MPRDVKNKVNRLVLRSMLLFIRLELSFGYINYFIEMNCRWPVPKPRWCRPEDVESDEDDDKLAFDSFGQLQYYHIHLLMLVDSVQQIFQHFSYAMLYSHLF